MARILFLLSIALFLALPATAGEIRVLAAASMTEVVGALGERYGADHPGVEVVSSFAGSGTLAKQIAHGAPADLYISANPQWMDYLRGQGRIVEETVRTLAYNELVFVGARGVEAAGMNDLKGLGRIAIGSPASVPAGRYAEKALRAAGLYQDLLDRGNLVMAKDVRQALMYADRGEVAGAFVYRTDALLSSRVNILFAAASPDGERVTYPMALTVAGARNGDAVDFLRFLRSPAACETLVRFGFLPD